MKRIQQNQSGQESQRCFFSAVQCDISNSIFLSTPLSPELSCITISVFKKTYIWKCVANIYIRHILIKVHDKKAWIHKRPHLHNIKHLRLGESSFILPSCSDFSQTIWSDSLYVFFKTENTLSGWMYFEAPVIKPWIGYLHLKSSVEERSYLCQWFC